MGKLRVRVDGSGCDIPIRAVLEIFFESLIKPSTKVSYRKAFESIFAENIFVEECSLEDFKSDSLSSTMEKIKDDLFLKPGQKRAACIALASFAAYLDAELGIKLGRDNKIDSERAYYEESTPLCIDEWEAFIDALRQFNPRDALIAEILQLANGQIFALLPTEILDDHDLGMKDSIQKAKESCSPEETVLEPEKIRKDKPAKGTPLVSLKMVLDLQAHDVSFSTQSLGFERIYRGSTVLQCYPFPQHIFSALCDFITSDRGLVFMTSNERPVAENQLKRSFKEASKRAKLDKTVSPVMVRIPVPGLVYCPFCHKPRWNKQCVCM